MDLTPEALANALPGRPLRIYPAMVSSEADALAWARAGAPEGGVVLAEHQASPRGRAGLEWQLEPGRGVVFSLVLRPALPVAREGWLYIVAACGLADALGGDATIEWPDEVRRNGTRAGAVGVHVELAPGRTEWAIVNVLLAEATPPRAPLVARAVDAIERRYRSPVTPALADYLRRCETIGRTVRARLIPLGPAGKVLSGQALRVLQDGALVLETDAGARVAIRPHHLGLLERAE